MAEDRILKSPPRNVRSIRELIFWEYAKLIARAAGFEKNYGFIMSRYKKLKTGEIKISDIFKDNKKQLKKGKECVYCGSNEHLSFDHIIPLNKGGKDNHDNIILACSTCNSSKGDKDLLEWFYVHKNEKRIPKLVLSKYLKIIWDHHVLERTLDKIDVNKDGEFNVLDLGAIFSKRKFSNRK